MLYVLDEPSIGLHQRDNQRLIETLDAPARPRQHGDRRRARRGDDPRRRLRRRHRPGRGRARRARSSTPARCRHERARCQQGVDHRAATSRAALDRGARPAPARATARRSSCAGRASTTSRDIDVAFPLGCLVAVTGVSARASRRSSTTSCCGRSPSDAATAPRRSPGRHRSVEGIEQLDKVIDIDQAPIGRTPRSNPATYTGVFDHIRRLFSQTPEAKVRGYQPGRFSFNVARRALRGLRRRRDDQDRDALPARRLRALRGLHGRPLQPRHARGHLPRQVHRRRARPVLRGGARVLRQPAADRPPPADPRRRRARLRPARPAGADALGRRGPAGEARLRALPATRPGTPSTSSTSRRPGCTSRTSASCSACCGASSTRATPSSSSSTTST